MISASSNRPGVAIWTSPMREILAGLRANVAPDKLVATFGLTSAAFLSHSATSHARATAQGLTRPWQGSTPNPRNGAG